MGKLDELEHDTHEDAANPPAAPPGLSQPLVLDEPEPTRPGARHAAKVKQRRAAMREARGVDDPWLSLENPAIWDGEIGGDDD